MTTNSGTRQVDAAYAAWKRIAESYANDPSLDDQEKDAWDTFRDACDATYGSGPCPHAQCPRPLPEDVSFTFVPES